MTPRPSTSRARSAKVRRARSASVPRRTRSASLGRPRSAPAALGHGPSNAQLIALARGLNQAFNSFDEKHKAQMARLYANAVKMGALHNTNYREAREAALAIHKRHMRSLHRKRNQLVSELLRNSRSTAGRRNLYAEGMRRGNGGTSQNNWQNWTNKLWYTKK